MNAMRPNKTIFFAKRHLFQKKRLFLQNNKKKGLSTTQICVNLSKQLLPDYDIIQTLLTPYYNRRERTRDVDLQE